MEELHAQLSALAAKLRKNPSQQSDLAKLDELIEGVEASGSPHKDRAVGQLRSARKDIEGGSFNMAATDVGTASLILRGSHPGISDR